MNKHEAAIMAINSSSITVAVGARSVNNTFCIKGLGEAAYDGYTNGEFVEPRKVADAVELALSGAVSGKNTIDRIFVGVPADFLKVSVKDVSLSFSRPRKVKPLDREKLLIGGEQVTDTQNNRLINRSPVYFEAEGLKTLAIPKITAPKISARVSYIFAQKLFMEIMNAVLEVEGIRDVKYLGAPLCQYLYLIEEKSPEKKTIILDVGHISSSITCGQGEGLTELCSLEAGGGYITLGLMDGLKISYAQAEILKRQLVLTLDAAESERYIIDEYSVAVPAAKANGLAIEGLYNLAETIAKCFEKKLIRIDEYTTVYLTGNGISYLRGAKDILEKVLGVSIETLKPRVPIFDKPVFSEFIGILDTALGNLNNTKKPHFPFRRTLNL